MTSANPPAQIPGEASPSQKPAKPRRDPRIRLWKAGGWVFMFVITFVVGNFFIPEDKAVTRRMLGHDFLAFYYAGTCVRTGHFEQLYDLNATKQFQAATGKAANLELGTSFGPFWNPPYAAWLFEPLAAYPYRTALLIWWTFGMACLATSIFILSQMLQGDWKTKALVPLFMLTTMPFFQAFSHGQNTFFSLLLLTLVVAYWRRGWSFAAGCVCGLLFYKPQLGAVVAVILVICQGRRALLGVTLVGFGLLLVNVLTLPGTLHIYFAQLPNNLHWMQEENHYLWERHVTFKGFWRLLIQGRAMGPTSPIVLALWGICQAALVSGLLAAVYATLRQPPSASRTDRLIAASIVSMPLLMPFYFDYDLLLISVGVVLYAVDRQRDWSLEAEYEWEDRWLPRLWMTLYITLQFGTIMAGHTRVHPVVPLVTFAAVMLIRRTLRPAQTISSGVRETPPAPLPLAA
jgi:alpha-1,2-mannosyltransferase